LQAQKNLGLIRRINNSLFYRRWRELVITISVSRKDFITRAQQMM
jgi:hypothetical protein